jgi:predicted nuclease of predicted toxin-antitoxin system
LPAPILGSVAHVNPPKLLLDENLSPQIAVRLRADGVDAVHVRDRGMLEASDAAVLASAFREDRMLVTSNVDDFARLARAVQVHPGLVLIEQGAVSCATSRWRSFEGPSF